MKLKKNYNLSLDQFIDLSLYDKKIGYYIKKNPFGKTGDFITAPNISRLFSEMIAIWVIIERFQNFPIFFNACNFVIHEKSPSLIKKQKKKIKKK